MVKRIGSLNCRSSFVVLHSLNLAIITRSMDWILFSFMNLFIELLTINFSDYTVEYLISHINWRAP